MPFEPWQLAAMDEYGYNEDRNSPIRQVAEHLAKHCVGTVGYEEFAQSCSACGVSPESFSQADITKLNLILERIS